MLHVLRVSAPACTAFNVPLFSLQIAVGFRASIQAGNLEALLRHLSSGEYPTQSFVSIDNRVLAHAGPVPSSCFHSFNSQLFALPSESHDFFRQTAGHHCMLRAITAKQDVQKLYLGEART